jgi:steroid delta-isomerase-like uncharacterized protein
VSEENKAVIHRLIEDLFNAGNLGLVDELISPDFIDHEEFPGLSPSREGLEQSISVFRNAFPDIRITIEDEIVAEGDRVAFHLTWRGTHRGEFMGIAATERSVEFTSTDIMRVEGGKLAEHWGSANTFAMMQQLGVIEEPTR